MSISLYLVSFPNSPFFLQLSAILKLLLFNFFKGSWSNISEFSTLLSNSSMSLMYSDLLIRTEMIPLSAFVHIKSLFFLRNSSVIFKLLTNFLSVLLIFTLLFSTKPLDKCKTLFLKSCWSDLGILCILASISWQFLSSALIHHLSHYYTKALSQSKDILHRIWHLNITQIYKSFLSQKLYANLSFAFGHYFLQNCTI